MSLMVVEGHYTPMCLRTSRTFLMELPAGSLLGINGWLFHSKTSSQLQHLASIVRIVPLCLIETSGFGKKHKWQNLNKSNNLEMKTIPLGSSLTSFPCMFNLKDTKSLCYLKTKTLLLKHCYHSLAGIVLK